jgi:hypothetical protein
MRFINSRLCNSSECGKNDHMGLWVTMVLLCSFIAGCKDVGTIWSTESRSPDGQWVALARTDQYGGPGTAGILSTVYLKSVKGPQDRIKVLLLSTQEATSLNVELNWLTPSHLEIAYRQPASIDFQAIKCAAIEISVRDLSKTTSSTSTK